METPSKHGSASHAAYWLGLTIVVLTHVYMLVAGLPQSMTTGHAVLNLVAGALLAFGWFKR